MYRLFLHPDARSDLESLWDSAPEAAAKITVLLEELESNQDLLDRLTQHKFGDRRSAEFQVSMWLEQWNQGRDLWRLKVWDLEKQGLRYRILYAFVPGKLQYHVLGIAPREFNYDADTDIAKRVLAAYAAL